MKSISGVINNIIDKENNNKIKEINYYDSLPEIDEKTAKVINYIFKRLAGIIPAFKYSTDNETCIDSIRIEYCYAIMRHKIYDLDVINKGLDRISDEKMTFLPSPGEFVKFCKPDPKWQTDTRNPEYFANNLLESDEDKKRRMELGRRYCADIFKKLKG